MTDAHAPQTPISTPVRDALLAELENYEHLAFVLMTQADLDGLRSLYAGWVRRLGDSPEAVAICDALDDFIDACIEDADISRAHQDLVATIQEGGE
ncbi:hypothetical protein [Halomonas sp. IOP_31]|uniref:hypothetical protein n=1 Tax=Halomonas sp. IOP_31 TaxID=2876584 RepID=UPI001E38D210|nr:hypothetical protein [Halomonas sp. IOP_31]MCD6010049.1 hypothetical protein [Halomonas sp. IOP_31]